MTKPFLRWAGGKARVVQRLSTFVPSEFQGATYHEPFVGAGALFFHLGPEASYLNDANRDLIACYRAVRDDPTRVHEALVELMERRDRDAYYETRLAYNKVVMSGVELAAHFIYLNKMCFNGIWRVNKAGEFNVPFGGKSRPGFPTADHLLECSAVLSRTNLSTGDFEDALGAVSAGDLVYLDPPYLPLSETAFFRHYTAARFELEDHKRLRDWVGDASRVGVKVVLTVGESEFVEQGYGALRLSPFEVRRYVGGSKRRKIVSELVVVNF